MKRYSRLSRFVYQLVVVWPTSLVALPANAITALTFGQISPNWEYKAIGYLFDVWFKRIRPLFEGHDEDSNG